MFWKVIEEIEEMMQESPDPEDDETPTQSDRLSMLSQEIQTLKRSSMSSYEESKRASFPLSLCFLSMSTHDIIISRELSSSWVLWLYNSLYILWSLFRTVLYFLQTLD